jgi:flagellar biosynthesis protein FlhB
MSDQPDRESKTEAPTEKRISDAIEKGNNPFSREIVSLGSLLALAAGLKLVVPAAVAALAFQLQLGFAGLEQVTLENASDGGHHLKGVLQSVGAIMLPFLLLLGVGGIVGSLVQNAPSANGTRVAPKWERLSLSRNLKRIIGKEAFIELAKTSAKFTVLSVIVYVTLRDKFGELVNAGFGEPAGLPSLLRDVGLDILVAVTVFVFLLAIVDIVWTRLKWWDDLKMTRQELKDEHKNAEGDPLLKQKRKAIALKRSRSRMLADVSKATLVVVNPTHFAVAMRYVPEEGGAPVVLAKGLDLLALKIRELSGEHRIPIVENKPLARSLYGACEVGDMIPAEYYRAVAEVIHFVERRRQLAKPRGV